eukprot:3397330-Amphidinium_carterae.1
MAAKSADDAPPTTDDTQPATCCFDAPTNAIDDPSSAPRPLEDVATLPLSDELQSVPHAATEASTTPVPPDERRSLEPLH